MAPDGFIQIAERSGLIREIGAEVLRRSCAELSGVACGGSGAGPWR